jgi:hypothetical protein
MDMTTVPPATTTAAPEVAPPVRVDPVRAAGQPAENAVQRPAGVLGEYVQLTGRPPVPG